MKYTIEQVDEAWGNFMKFTETAEQHDFPALAAFQFKFEPLYKDLHERWDEHHAEIFMKWMQKIGEYFGFKVPDISKGE